MGEPDDLRITVDIPDKLDADTVKKLKEASPINYVKKDMPPYLLVHGTNDDKVPFELSVSMCAKMKDAGASCELFTVEDVNLADGKLSTRSGAILAPLATPTPAPPEAPIEPTPLPILQPER